MAALRAVIEQKEGVFCALYSDRASHFFVTSGRRTGGQAPTDAGFEGYAERIERSDDSGAFVSKRVAAASGAALEPGKAAYRRNSAWPV